MKLQLVISIAADIPAGHQIYGLRVRGFVAIVTLEPRLRLFYYKGSFVGTDPPLALASIIAAVVAAPPPPILLDIFDNELAYTGADGCARSVEIPSDFFAADYDPVTGAVYVLTDAGIHAVVPA